MALEGKGFYIWKVHQCEGGDPTAIVQRAKDAGLSHVLVKIADGSSAYNVDLAAPVTDALKAAGLKAWGWQFVYGNEPFAEADIAIHRINTLALDGFVINAESAYKQKYDAASAYIHRLRDAHPDLDVALSSFRYPTYHPTVPWTQFLSHCTYNMPQVYWIQAENPDQQLVWSIGQFDNINPVVPIVPTGAAYEEFGWRATPDQITRFLQKAKDLGLSGANFWSWDYAGSAQGTDLWDAVANFDWPVQLEPDIVQKLEAALNAADIDAIVALYHPNAVHVTADRTIKGPEQLRFYYQELLTGLLPNAQFTLTTLASQGAIRHVNWNANSDTGNVLAGQDTIGVRQGLIQYHSSLYVIS